MYNNITLNQKESEHMAPFGRGAQQCNGIEKHGSAHTYHQHCHNTITTPQTVTNVKSNSNATFFFEGTTSTSAPTESLVDGRPNSGTEEEMGCSKVCCRTRLAQTGWRGAVTASRFACFRNIKLKTEFKF